MTTDDFSQLSFPPGVTSRTRLPEFQCEAGRIHRTGMVVASTFAKHVLPRLPKFRINEAQGRLVQDPVPPLTTAPRC